MNTARDISVRISKSLGAELGAEQQKSQFGAPLSKQDLKQPRPRMRPYPALVFSGFGPPHEH